MSDWLPKQIDAYKLGRKKAALAGAIDLDSLHELKTMVSMPGSGPGAGTYETRINAKISFDYARGAALIQGQVIADLVVLCQRCLQPMPLRLDSALCFAVQTVSTTATCLVRGTQEFELLEDSGEELDLYGLIEEELILSLPLVARHALSVCPARDYIAQAHEPVTEPGADETTVKPFSGLKDRLRKSKTKPH